jgi:UPF0755 protein
VSHHLGIDELHDQDQKIHHKHGRGLIAVAVALAIMIGGGVFIYVKGVDLIQDALSEPADDYSGNGHGSVVVQVKEGDTTTDIAETLVDRGVVKTADAFVEAASADERALSIQVGFYTLREEMSAQSALELLLDPESRVTNLLTIPEGLRVQETLRRIVRGTEFTPQEVGRAASDPAALGLPSYAGGQLEGYLFPATYDVTPDLTATGLLSAMVDRFGVQAEEIGLERAAADLGITPGELVTVASLVQAEASRMEDMPKVAAVIYNRLDAGMPLQLDSTLHYAAGLRGEVVAGEDLQKIDSPYNTYQHVGLPPGPIASPGADALAAAANPADVDYRYFVTINLATGRTLFAERLAEHERNRQRYFEYCETSDEC